MEFKNYSIENVDQEAWNLVLDESDYSTVFHSLEWIEALLKVSKLQENLLIGWKNGKPQCILPFFTVKTLIFKINGSPLPETGAMYGGPLFIKGMDTANKAIDVFEGEKNLLSSSFLKLPPYYPVDIFRDRSYEIEKVPTFLLELKGGKDVLWGEISKKARNSVRKAQKSGVAIIEGDVESLDTYYDMHLDTCEKNSLNPLDKSLLHSIIQNLHDKGLLKILLAQKDGATLAGSIFLFHKKSILYWMGDSYSDSLKYCPNDLIQWSIIAFGIKKGYTTYDLGGAGVPGITSFKRKWGGKEVYFYRAFRGSLMTKEIKRLYQVGRKNPIVSRLFRRNL